MTNVLMASRNAQLVFDPNQGPGGEFFGSIACKTVNATGFERRHTMWLIKDHPITRCIEVIRGYNNMEFNQQCADPLKLQNAQTGLILALIENDGYSSLKIANMMQGQKWEPLDISKHSPFLLAEPKQVYAPPQKTPVEIGMEEKDQIKRTVGVILGLLGLMIVQNVARDVQAALVI